MFLRWFPQKKNTIRLMKRNSLSILISFLNELLDFLYYLVFLELFELF